MTKAASITSSIFDELIVTVESIGVDKTIKSLQQARTALFYNQDVKIDFIINLVVDITGISREVILNGKDKSDERKMATALSVFFIKNKLNYSYKQLSKIFNKDESALFRYYKIVSELKNPKTDFDKKLSDYHKKLTALIEK
jgi:hypothetical protein